VPSRPTVSAPMCRDTTPPACRALTAIANAAGGCVPFTLPSFLLWLGSARYNTDVLVERRGLPGIEALRQLSSNGLAGPRQRTRRHRLRGLGTVRILGCSQTQEHFGCSLDWRHVEGMVSLAGKVTWASHPPVFERSSCAGWSPASQSDSSIALVFVHRAIWWIETVAGTRRPAS